GSAGGQHHSQGCRSGKRIQGDLDLQEILDYIVPLGIPLSVFKNWDESDQDYALAWNRHKREHDSKFCSSCGTNPDAWLGEDGKALAPAPYKVTTKRCRGCEALAAERKLVDESQADSRNYIYGFTVNDEDSGSDGKRRT